MIKIKIIIIIRRIYIVKLRHFCNMLKAFLQQQGILATFQGIFATYRAILQHCVGPLMIIIIMIEKQQQPPSPKKKYPYNTSDGGPHGNSHKIGTINRCCKDPKSRCCRDLKSTSFLCKCNLTKSQLASVSLLKSFSISY